MRDGSRAWTESLKRTRCGKEDVFGQLDLFRPITGWDLKKKKRENKTKKKKKGTITRTVLIE